MTQRISVHDGSHESAMGGEAGVAVSGYGLGHLSNDELLAGTRRLVGRSNQLLARLLAHLAEVEARGIHRERACASLYAYCVYELRLSEDAASRRARAARIVRRAPEVLDAVARGELHLTGLLLLGPHLTEANCRSVLARAKHRTKREIERLVRQLDPLPDVPAVVEPLGPGRPGLAVPRNPTWRQFVESFNPVRELEPGVRPSDWMGEAVAEATTEEELGELGRSAPVDVPTTPQRYKIQFTAGERYVELLRRAGDLLSHAEPSVSLESLHERALEQLVESLEKKKYAIAAAPGESKEHTGVPRQSGSVKQQEAREGDASAERGDARAERGDAVPRESNGHTRVPRQSGNASMRDEPVRDAAAPTRHVPAAVRRTVWQRDGGRCSYVDPRGQRCRETAFLELHHLEPHARGGPATEANITLRCHAHNALAAEQDFGRELIASKRLRR